MAFYKNTASQKFYVYAWDSVNKVPKTGDASNITARISKDGGASAQTNDVNPTEIDATYMKGLYAFDATQAESNANAILVSAVSSTSGIVIEPLIIYTEPEVRSADVVNWKGSTAPAMTGDAYARLGAPAGASVSADVAAVKSDSGSIKTKTDGLNFDGSYVQSQVKGQDNIDFGALQKASITAAVPSVASIQSGLATPTNITAGTITTVTNLTNAPTNGDLTATMKTSVRTAVETQLTSANTELGAIPTTISGLRMMIQFIFQKLRNQSDMNKTTGVETMYKEDASTPLGTATHSDDGTTVTKGEFN